MTWHKGRELTEKRIGPIDSALFGAVEHLDDVTPEIEATCHEFYKRHKNYITLAMYIGYIVRDFRGEKHVINFIEDVFIKKRISASQWGRSAGAYYSPHPDWRRITLSKYLEAFKDVPGERWFSLDGTVDPGVLIEKPMRYFEMPDFPGLGYFSNIRKSDCVYISEEYFPIYFRRHTAKRIAWHARILMLSPNAIISPETVAAAAGMGNTALDAIADDTRIALEAIVAEARAAGPNAHTHEYGTGPDELYANRP